MAAGPSVLRRQYSLSITHYDEATENDIAAPIRKAVDQTAKYENDAWSKVLDARKMVWPNSQLTLKLIVHTGDDQHQFLMDVANSVRWVELEKAMRSRCGDRLPAKHRFFWVNPRGNVLELNSSDSFGRFLLSMWCTHPWEIHAHAGGSVLGSLKYVSHVWLATVLFTRYDVNGSGHIERRELLRLLADLKLERLRIPQQQVERFVEVEFTRLDVDRSGGIELAEFLTYVADLSCWLRSELKLEFHQRNIFELLTARGAGINLPAAPLPEPQRLHPGAWSDWRQVGGQATLASTLNVSERFGIALQIPTEAANGTADLGVDELSVEDLSERMRRGAGQRNRPLIAVRTLAAASVTYLSEGSDLPPFPFSPIIQVAFPAVEDRQGVGRNHVTELSSKQAKRFVRPLTLRMPHCFAPEAGVASVVMVGAPHGATQWERIDLVRSSEDVKAGGALCMNGAELSVSLPCIHEPCLESQGASEVASSAPAPARIAALLPLNSTTPCAHFPFLFPPSALPDAGIFVALADRAVDNFAAVRFHVFTSPELHCDVPSTLRLHLCPELPDIADEVKLAETSQYGQTRHVGHSPLVFLARGAKFQVRYLGQQAELAWHGSRVHAEFVIPAAAKLGQVRSHAAERRWALLRHACSLADRSDMPQAGGSTHKVGDMLQAGGSTYKVGAATEALVEGPPSDNGSPSSIWWSTDSKRAMKHGWPDFEGTVVIRMLAGGEGKYATVQSAAMRAGLPEAASEAGYLLRFASQLCPTSRPPKPTLQLRERTPNTFTVMWRAPHATEQASAMEAAEPDVITHYAIDLASTEPNGTYLPWKVSPRPMFV